SAFRCGSIRARSPTKTTRNCGSAATACTAPATTGPGAWSPPIASSASCMALLLLLRPDHLPALAAAAARAGPVPQHRLIARRPVLDLEGFDVQVAPPLALAGVRSPSLGNSHGSVAFSVSFVCSGRRAGGRGPTRRFSCHKGRRRLCPPPEIQHLTIRN